MLRSPAIRMRYDRAKWYRAQDHVYLSYSSFQSTPERVRVPDLEWMLSAQNFGSSFLHLYVVLQIRLTIITKKAYAQILCAFHALRLLLSLNLHLHVSPIPERYFHDLHRFYSDSVY